MAEGHVTQLTLIICTHNRAPSLAATLEAIAMQQVPAIVRWDVLVVTNACTDETNSVAERYAQDSRIPLLRVVDEPRPGVAYARCTGVRHSSATWVAMVDDDCLLAPDWVHQASTFAESQPYAGAFAGRNEIVWPPDTPLWCMDHADSLAHQNFGEEPRRLPDRGRPAPCGAGLILNRSALMGSGFLDRGRLVGRGPRDVHAGEDSEMVFFIRNAGWEVWYTPDLHLRHVITRSRTTLHYQCSLHHGFGLVEGYLRLLSHHEPLTPRNRNRSLWWAVEEMVRVLLLMPRQYFFGKGTSPAWLIRYHHALGFMEGALRLAKGTKSERSSDNVSLPTKG
ncbi:glycosyltransferase involved in cell wall biosynthesis [Roseimicrobium gellanilyticum]|uniref:Glycosyltransferase involved in cell wall biosynthesis n=1 Tax=Roseimicrobium gellanilyticum TaxID=748857 RepID=A0A366HNJ7_9BACT|nr:glycosyltransferase [Roseimicrobium gellanilyticum]RBP43892.1 glycosyltransferase involved in cell wall biosynthesis [Roseimicrobium gellanilyticum]